MPLHTKSKALFLADLKREVNLFLGAGFSVLAKNVRSEPIPLGNELRLQLIDHFELGDFSELNLPQIYALILSDRKEALRRFLIETYDVKSYDDRYHNLRKINAKFIYTTNIDNLCSKIFVPDGDGSGLTLHDRHLFGAPRSPERVANFIPLHGNIEHPDTDFLFTAGQMASAFASDRETWYVFQRELVSRPTFFMGYSMNDAGVLQAIHDSSAHGDFNRWMLLRKEKPAERAYFESLGFQVAIGEISDFLEEASNLAPAVRQKSDARHLIGAVPSVGAVAKRPVKSFFVGAEPEWSDAYSAQIAKRKINSKIINSVHSKRHCAVVGLPLSGKTTVLKQVAAALSDDMHCLYFDKISEPQSKIITSEIEGLDDVVVFVDNMIDSMRQIEFIMRQTSALFVCAEQSVYFDGVRLKAFGNKLDVHSATEIDTQEIQKIIETIPAEVRRWRTAPTAVSDELETGIEDGGIFLALSKAVYDESLMNRFKTKLREFEEKDREAFDVYIMACYVYRCRTIVSFDMMYMFLSNTKKDYSYAYEVASRISHFLAEVDLEIEEFQDQDYFSVRSGGLAEIALKQCRNSSFERMFARFHDAVPETVIADYPTFRRYAYNSDFVGRAFPNHRAGLRFFERLVRKTQNAYDYQHGAIYLSRKKQFSLAFDWIDTALNMSGARIFSIRNTHARILFEANMDVLTSDQDNETAKEGVSNSMKVLQGIIVDDSTRGYHLFTFCNQAIQYRDVSVDGPGEDWLREASVRLKDLISQAQKPGARESHNLFKYRRILRDVEDRLP